MKLYTFLVLTALVALFSCANKTTGTIENTKSNDIPMDSKIKEIADAGYVYDSISTPAGRNVNLVFIKHGSIIVDVDGYLVYIDPVTMYGNDFTAIPKADMLLVTHEHHDHFDPTAIEQLSDRDTELIMSRRVAELYGKGRGVVPGDTVEVEPANFTITAVPAYNITPDHLQFHPKERKDVGFVFDIDGLRIYVAGDTEDIAEMAALDDIDVAFLPVNQPYTMTPQQAIQAVEMIEGARHADRPGKLIVYPYHYGDTDLSPLVVKFEDSPVDVRVRQLQ